MKGASRCCRVLFLQLATWACSPVHKLLSHILVVGVLSEGASLQQKKFKSIIIL